MVDGRFAGDADRGPREHSLRLTFLFLSWLAIVETLALAAPHDLLRPRVWVLELALMAALAVFALGMGVLGAWSLRAAGRRAAAGDVALAWAVALVAVGCVGGLVVERLPGILSRSYLARSSLLVAVALCAWWLLRTAMQRLGFSRRALASVVFGLAATQTLFYAAIRGAHRAGLVAEWRLEIVVVAVLLAASVVVAALVLRRRPLLAVSVCLGIGLLALRLLLPNAQGWTGVARNATAPEGAPPVVFIVLDTFRGDSLDVGPPEESRTPALARLARVGTWSDSGIANGSWTLTGHASLFTGLTVGRHRTDVTAEPGFSAYLPRTLPIAHELFARKGYRTVCITSNGIVGTGSGLSRGCQRYINPGRAWMRALLPWRLAELCLPSPGAFRELAVDLGRVGLNGDAREVVDRALDVAEEGSQGLYLFLNFLDVHRPYPPAGRSTVPDAALAALRADYVAMMFGSMNHAELFARHHGTLRAIYDEEVGRLDAQLGRLFDAMKDGGWFDDALILVTSDHGEGFLENPAIDGYFGHHSAWEPAVRIPLVVKLPGQTTGAPLARPFQQADVLPTLLEGAGLDAVPGLEGRPVSEEADVPLVTEWYERRGAAATRYFPGNRLALYDGSYKYVLENDGIERLYDLESSPYEADEVAASRPELAARLRRKMAALTASRPKSGEAAAEADPALLEQLRALGYAE